MVKFLPILKILLLWGLLTNISAYAQVANSTSTEVVRQRLDHWQMEFAGYQGRLLAHDRGAAGSWMDSSFQWVADYLGDARDSLRWYRRNLRTIEALLNQARQQLRSGEQGPLAVTMSRLDNYMNQADNEWRQSVRQGLNGAQGFTGATIGVGAVCSGAVAPAIVGATGLAHLSPTVAAVIFSGELHLAGAAIMSQLPPAPPQASRSSINLTLAQSRGAPLQTVPLEVSSSTPPVATTTTTPPTPGSHTMSPSSTTPRRGVARRSANEQPSATSAAADVAEAAEPEAPSVVQQRQEAQLLEQLRAPAPTGRAAVAETPVTGLRPVAQLVAQVQQGLLTWHRTGRAPFDWARLQMELEANQFHPSARTYRAAQARWQRSVQRYRRIARESGARREGLRRVVNAVIQDYLHMYHRGQTDVFRAVTGDGANCVGQTQVLIAAITQSGLSLPPGEELAVQNFADHLQVVTYNRTTKVAYEVLTGRTQEHIIADVYEPPILAWGVLGHHHAPAGVSDEQLLIERHAPSVGLRANANHRDYGPLPGNVGLSMPRSDVVAANGSIPEFADVPTLAAGGSGHAPPERVPQVAGGVQMDETEVESEYNAALRMQVANAMHIPANEQPAFFERLAAVDNISDPVQRRLYATRLRTELLREFADRRIAPAERYLRDPSLLLQLPTAQAQAAISDTFALRTNADCTAILDVTMWDGSADCDRALSSYNNTLEQFKQRMYDHPESTLAILTRLGPASQEMWNALNNLYVPYHGAAWAPEAWPMPSSDGRMGAYQISILTSMYRAIMDPQRVAVIRQQRAGILPTEVEFELIGGATPSNTAVPVTTGGTQPQSGQSQTASPGRTGSRHGRGDSTVTATTAPIQVTPDRMAELILQYQDRVHHLRRGDLWARWPEERNQDFLTNTDRAFSFLLNFRGIARGQSGSYPAPPGLGLTGISRAMAETLYSFAQQHAVAMHDCMNSGLCFETRAQAENYFQTLRTHLGEDRPSIVFPQQGSLGSLDRREPASYRRWFTNQPRPP